MYHHISGVISHLTPNEVVLETGGVGYLIEISLPVYQEFKGHEGSEGLLYIFPYFREDSHRLFGFLSLKDREIFRLLLSVRGLGPVNALSLLSGLSMENLHAAIIFKTPEVLQRVKGIGKRTAERIILELHEKLPPLETSSRVETSGEVETACLALEGLGYSREEAVKSVKRSVEIEPDADAPVWIKLALQSR